MGGKVFPILSLVFSILGIALCCIPGVGLALGLLAVILGIIGLVRKDSLTPMSIIGIVIGVVGLALGGFVLFSSIVGKSISPSTIVDNPSSIADIVSDDSTLGQRNALASAKTYISTMSFSEEGLRHQLEFEGYEQDEIDYALENLEVDWNEQAAKSARDYLNSMSFSRKELYNQLIFEGYTEEQAEYGVQAVGYGDSDDSDEVEDDSNSDNREEATDEEDDGATIGQRNALGQAENYISMMPFSEKGLRQQLEFEGYEQEDIDYALDNLEVDWNEQAALKAESYLDMMNFSKSELLEQLKFEGFTDEQAKYGVEAVGY